MAYVLLLVYFFVVVPNVLCDDSGEEFCPEQTTGRSSLPKRYPGVETPAWKTKTFQITSCTVPVCNVNEGKEETGQLSCPNVSAPPHDRNKCVQMGARLDLVDGQLPFCCPAYLCENVTADFQEDGNQNDPDRAKKEYPSRSRYDEYLTLYLKGNEDDTSEGESCKDFGFQLPSHCKLLDEDATTKSDGGCRYQCVIPLFKTVTVTNPTKSDDCSFTHKGNKISKKDRENKCEKWDCNNGKLHLHMCIHNTSTISYPGNCTVMKSETPDSPTSYPDCCPRLNCTTQLPWQFGSSTELYMRAFP